MDGENRQIIEGVIWKQLLIFFFPILLGTFFQQLYNTVDAIIVGRFLGKEALAAVGGPSGYLVNLLLGFFIGLCSGATVVIAQFFGAGDAEHASRAVHTSMALSIAAGAAMSLVGAFLAEPALTAMDTPPEVLPHAVSYLRIYFGGILFMFVYNMGAAVLRAKGDSKRPFYLLVLATIVNIAGDIVFVVHWGWGVAGAAYATVLSQLASAAGVWIFLAREAGAFRLRLRGLLRPDRVILGSVVRIGLPSGLQSTMYSLSNIVIQSTVNGFGVDTVAAWTVCGKVDRMYWLIINALGVAVSTFSGQNFGARKYDRVLRSIGVSAALGTALSLFFGAVFVTWGAPLYGIFTDDPAVISIGMEIIWLIAPWYFAYVPVGTLASGMRGTGDAIVPTAMTALGICGFRLLWIWFVVPFSHSVRTVFIGYPVSWALTSVFFLLYHRKGNWMQRSILRAGHKTVRRG